MVNGSEHNRGKKIDAKHRRQLRLAKKKGPRREKRISHEDLVLSINAGLSDALQTQVCINPWTPAASLPLPPHLDQLRRQKNPRGRDSPLSAVPVSPPCTFDVCPLTLCALQRPNDFLIFHFSLHFSVRWNCQGCSTDQKVPQHCCTQPTHPSPSHPSASSSSLSLLPILTGATRPRLSPRRARQSARCSSRCDARRRQACSPTCPHP